MHAYFSKHGHLVVNVAFDAAIFQNRKANRAVYDKLGITPKQSAPEQQIWDRAEQDI